MGGMSSSVGYFIVRSNQELYTFGVRIRIPTNGRICKIEVRDGPLSSCVRLKQPSLAIRKPSLRARLPTTAIRH